MPQARYRRLHLAVMVASVIIVGLILWTVLLTHARMGDDLIYTVGVLSLLTIVIVMLFVVVYRRTRDHDKYVRGLQDAVARRTEDLAQSEKRYRSLIEDVHEGISIVSLDGRQAYFSNPAAYRMLDTLEENRTRPANPLNLLRPRDKAAALREIDAAAAVGQSATAAYRALTSNGRPIWLEMSASLVDFDGSSAIMLTFRDATETQRIAEALRESEEKFRNFVQHSADGMFLVDDAGTIVSWNEALERITGVTAGDAIGQPAWRVTYGMVAPDKRSDEVKSKLIEGLNDVLAAEKEETWYSSQSPKEICLPSGELRITTTQAFPIRTEKARMVGCIVRDITERDAMERALRESEERYRQLVLLSPDGIIMIKDNTIVYANPAFAEMFGAVTDMQMIGAPLQLFLKPDEDAQTGAGLLPQDSQSTQTRRAVRIDGTEFDVELSAVPFSLDGQTAHLGILRDITARKMAEDALQWELNVTATLADLYGPLVQSGSRIEDIASSILERACLLTTSTRGYASAIDPSTGDNVSHASTVDSDDKGNPTIVKARVSFPREANGEHSGIFGRALNTRTAEFDNRVDFPLENSDADSTPQSVYAMLSVPVLLGDQLLGQIALANPRRRYFDRDVKAIQRIATYYALAIQRHRDEQALRHASLHDPLTDLFNRAYFDEEIRRLQNGRSYPITLVSTDVDGLKLINDTMGHQAGDAILRAYALVLTATFRTYDVIARIGGDEFAIILPRTDAETAEKLYARAEQQVQAHNIVRPDIPLSFSWGTHTVNDPFTSLEQAFKLADLDMYRDKLRRNAGTKHRLVDTLLLALSTKDHATEGHTRRVRDLAVALGKAVQLSKHQLADLSLLAEVHDLGKVGIPDRILQKSGPLTEQEWEEMKQHSDIGYKIALSSPDLSHIAKLVLYHHECWDGTGYPSGLVEESIPIECRILALADAFDAMTNDRPYRAAMGVEEALSQIQHGAGHQFDPELAVRFLTLVRQSQMLSVETA